MHVQTCLNIRKYRESSFHGGVVRQPGLVPGKIEKAIFITVEVL